MKVYSSPSLFQIMNRTATKAGDKEGGAGRNAYDPNQNKKDQSEPETYQATEEKVAQAIESFAQDQVNLGLGFTATQEGQGPGLKVLLKDSAGGLLRAVSGEEFLKLREAAKSGQKSGRLLDRKG